MSSERRPLHLKRTLAGFVPSDRNSEQMLERYPIGTIVRADVKMGRNIAHHRLWWGLLSLIADNLDAPIDAEGLHEIIKLRTGHVIRFKTRSGIVEIPGSIKFSKMDQAEFKAFFDKGVQFICAEIIPGLNEADLQAEILDMMGGGNGAA